MQTVSHMPKTGLCLGQRMENFCMSSCATAGNIQAIKEMVSKRRDDRYFFVSPYSHQLALYVRILYAAQFSMVGLFAVCSELHSR